MLEGDILCRYCAAMGLDNLQKDSGGYLTLEICKGSYVCNKCKKAFPSTAFRVGLAYRRDASYVARLVEFDKLVDIASNTSGMVILPSYKNKQACWVWEY